MEKWGMGGGGSLFKVYFPSTEQAAQNSTDNLCGDFYGGVGEGGITLLSIYFPSAEQTEQNSTSIKIVLEGIHVLLIGRNLYSSNI